MGHKKLDISLTNEKLEAAMYAEMYERKIQCKQLHKTLHLAASLIEVRQISYKLNFNCWLPIQIQVGYHHCAFEEKKAIAMYNWYSIPAYIYIHTTNMRSAGLLSTLTTRHAKTLPLSPFFSSVSSAACRNWTPCSRLSRMSSCLYTITTTFLSWTPFLPPPSILSTRVAWNRQSNLSL